MDLANLVRDAEKDAGCPACAAADLDRAGVHAALVERARLAGMLSDRPFSWVLDPDGGCVCGDIRAAAMVCAADGQLRLIDQG